jgi:hypothetical protein
LYGLTGAQYGSVALVAVGVWLLATTSRRPEVDVAEAAQ